MTLDINQSENTYTIKVQCSRLTLACSEELKERVKPLLSQNGSTAIIDLGGVKFIDSSGIGSLLALVKQAKMCNSKLYIANIEDGVKDLFVLLRLDKIFEIK